MCKIFSVVTPRPVLLCSPEGSLGLHIGGLAMQRLSGGQNVPEASGATAELKALASPALTPALQATSRPSALLHTARPRPWFYLMPWGSGHPRPAPRAH